MTEAPPETGLELRSLVTPDGMLELDNGGDERSGNGMPLHPDTDHLLVRRSPVEPEFSGNAAHT